MVPQTAPWWIPKDSVDLSLAVEAFITTNGIDEEASNALRLESEDIQRAVIAKDMTGAKNPSYTLLGRILKAKNQVPAKQKLCEKFAVGQCGFTAEQCYFSHDRDLVKQKRVERVAGVYGCEVEEAMRIMAKQKTVMCKNFDIGSCTYGAKCNFAHSRDELPEGRAEVEAFIREHQLQNNVAKFLLSQSHEVQKMVIAKGGVDCAAEHASAQFMGRIRDAVWCHENNVTGPSAEEVETFIIEGKLDDRAASMLRNAGPPIQLDVLGQGALPTVQNNPSAACVGRIQDAKKRFRDQMKYGITSPAPVVHGTSPGVSGVASSSQLAQIATAAPALQAWQDLQNLQVLQAAAHAVMTQQPGGAIGYQQQVSSIVGLQARPQLPAITAPAWDPAQLSSLVAAAAANPAAHGVRFTPY